MPRRMSDWRATAAAVIDRRLEEGRAQGLTGRDLARYVSEGYPFGERAHHPYKIWLHEFEWRVKGVVRPFSSRARKRHREAVPDAQGWLFDVTRAQTEG